MAKIEIELEELNAIQERLKHFERLNEELRIKIDLLAEHRLIDRAANLAKSLAESYIDAVFKSCGFESSNVRLEHNFIEAIQGNYWNVDLSKVEIGASITTQITHAYLAMGIDLDKINSNKNKLKLPD